MRLKKLIILTLCIVCSSVAAANPAGGAEDQVLVRRQDFLRTLTEALTLNTAATNVDLGARHLGSAEGLKLEETLLGLMASVVQEHRGEMPKFEAMPERVPWYDLAYFAITEVSQKISPSMPLESAAAWLLGRVPMLARSAWEITWELPPEFIALANEGYREHGQFYLLTVALTFPPYFLATEFLEHAVLHLPPAFGCAQIQFAYFAAVGALMRPISAFRSRAMTHTETASYRDRMRRSLTSLEHYLRDWPEQRALHQKLGLLSEGPDAQTLFFDRKKLSAKDFAAGGEHLIEKLAKHPLFWPVIALLLERENLEGEELAATEGVTSTLREQIESVLGPDRPVGEADRILDRIVRQMKLRQQVELFRWILKLHTESIKDMWEADQLKFWAEYNKVRGSIGKLRGALSDYDYSMRFMIENPELISDPQGRGKEMARLVQEKIVRGFALIDAFYQSQDKSAAALELEAHVFETAATFKRLRQGRVFGPCEAAASHALKVE